MPLIMVCGSRGWTDADAIRQVLARFDPVDTLLIHGGARGADRMAAVIGIELGFKVEAMPAQWDTLGKRAGMIRNRRMLDRHPDYVIAFWDGSSRGTQDAVKEATRRGIACTVVLPSP